MYEYFIRLSKFLAYLLRHVPDKFNLKLDSNGFANLEDVIKILKNRFNDNNISIELLKKVIENSDKKRFCIINNKIKALYGHSLKQKIVMPEAEILPNRLYHGTTSKAFNKIKKEGLKRKKRQYVHLSDNPEIAFKTGLRRTIRPIILVIDAFGAKNEGIKFYKSGDMYLADYIPPKFMSIYKKGNLNT